MSYILLIEDNQIHAEMLMRILKAAGFEVRHTNRGALGIEQAKKERPSLIFVDFGLPEMNGPTTIAKLKEALAENTPPIIALTAYSDYETKNTAKQLGCAAFMTKPYLPNDVVDKVNKILMPEAEPKKPVV